MYIGGTGQSGRLHMVIEIAANSFDQVLAGAADAITVAIERDGTIAISDNGPGISTAVEADGRTFLERVCTEHHETPTADDHRPHIHLGLGGLGMFPICALSEFMDIETCDGSITRRQSFGRGRPTTELETIRPQDASAESGTTVRFRPDPEIFGTQPFPVGRLEAELSALTDLVPGVSLTIKVEQTYGPSQDLRHLHQATWSHLSPPEGPDLIEHVTPTGRAALALSFHSGGWKLQIRSFCNYHETIEGGSHVRGIEEGLGKVFGSSVPAVLDRLAVVLHVTLDDPKFGGPTRGRLDSPEAIALVADAVAEQLPSILALRPELAEELRALAASTSD